jgi:putative hemolysin
MIGGTLTIERSPQGGMIVMCSAPNPAEAGK